MQTPSTAWHAPLRARFAAFALVTLFSSCAWAVSPGDAAPEFDLAGKNGPVKLSDFKGKTVYVDFWASWCGPCRQSFPWMNELQAKYAGQGLSVIAINLDVRSADAQKFLVAVPHEFTIAFDPKGQTPRQYGVKGMPTSFLVGKDGRVLFQHTGFHSDKRDELEQKIREAL